MPVFKAPVDDTLFILNDVLGYERYMNLPSFADASPDIVEAILQEGARISEEVMLPLNQVGDQEGCTRHDDGTVSTPKGFKQAYKQYCEGGWLGLAAPTEYGGQGLPYTLHTAVSEYMISANLSLLMYPGLTQGAVAAINEHGTDEQKATYLPKMIEGVWTGTMNLTEPHCGTDLGLLRTKAVPQADGSYKISGQKIFISAGEHDMSDNIIHLVLARIEGAPEGVKGISLFIVPKFMVGEDGALGERNPVTCGSLEEKMGIHGNATCVMNYDDATGYLIGAENAGLKAMFVMMNEARLGVGLQGLAQAEIAYQNAVDFAHDRVQGRSLNGAKAPEKVADPIIVHPDVRRMLLDQKAFIEGARAFAYWTAFHGDLQHKSADEKVRERAGDYMALLTPVVKAYLTHKGFESANLGLQVHGGSGFTREWGLEQYVRDVRITLIYEGTNGIQALDLVGRKLASNGGRAVFSFFAELDDFIGTAGDDPALQPFVEGLKTAKNQLQEGTTWLMQNGMSDFNNAGASSHDYLHLFGLTALAYMWARMAKVAVEKRGAGDPFYDEKLITGQYFLDRMLPDAGAHLAKVKTGAKAMMALPADAF
jgi:alkylation response protein AidB-like acyl-CoA dehydrogenase